MSTKTLFLAWQDARAESRRWFPIGRLDVERAHYRFRYIGGAKIAESHGGFLPLPDFPSMKQDYRSMELFPLFRNRVIAKGRPDREAYLQNLDLPNDADPAEILSVNGGARVTDSFEVFPKLEKGANGKFKCRFFLHGWRYVSECAKRRTSSLEPEEKLYVTLELKNPATGLAVQIQTADYHVIGWTPRYLVDDLAKAIIEKSLAHEARVVRINPQPAPSSQRVLIEMQGRWERHNPMSGPGFQPLVD